MENFLIEADKIWEKAVIQTGGISLDADFEKQSRLLKIFSVGDYYYYIFNVKDVTFEYISPEFTEVLGFETDTMTVSAFLMLIHPDDRPWFLNFEHKVVEFFSTLTSSQIPSYKIRYDYRVRKSTGEYIRILQQVVTIGYQMDGSVIKTLGIHTDISHIKMDGRPIFSLIGMDGEPSFIDVDVERIFKPTEPLISRREKEILDLLMQGKQSREIADRLFISKATVDKHRNNILSKTNVSNTAELIAFSIRKGWV